MIAKPLTLPSPLRGEGRGEGRGIKGKDMRIRKITVFLVFSLLFLSGTAHAGRVDLDKLKPEEAPVEQRIAAGQGVFWTLSRRGLSYRGQTMLDGVIIAPEEAELRLKVIQRDNGDHRVLLGAKGTAGQPVSALEPLVKDMGREKMVPYRLDMGKEIVAVYVPHGAVLTAREEKEGTLIDMEIPQEKREKKHSIEPFSQMGRY